MYETGIEHIQRAPELVLVIATIAIYGVEGGMRKRAADTMDV